MSIQVTNSATSDASGAGAIRELEGKIQFSSYIRTLVEAEPGIFLEPNRLRAFLMDEFPQKRREIRALHLAAEDNVPIALRRVASHEKNLEIEAQRQIGKLEHQHGLAPALAAWTVGVLTLAVRTSSVGGGSLPIDPAAGPVGSEPVGASGVGGVSAGVSGAPAPERSKATGSSQESLAKPHVPETPSRSELPPKERAAEPALSAGGSPALAALRRHKGVAFGVAAALIGLTVLILTSSHQSSTQPTYHPPEPSPTYRPSPTYQPTPEPTRIEPTNTWTPTPSATPSQAVSNGVHSGKRGWTDGDSSLCESEYSFDVTVDGDSISFDSDGNSWSGTINQTTGYVDMTTPGEPDLYIRGYYKNAEMGGGTACRSGFFRMN